jgi:hypothetical protein
MDPDTAYAAEDSTPWHELLVDGTFSKATLAMEPAGNRVLLA